MRALLILVLSALVLFVAFALWNGVSFAPAKADRPAGTTGVIDTAKARERGAELGEKAAVAGEKLKETIAEGGVTAKIKAKMALDDTVKARRIDVTTSGATVTVSGTVASKAEHDRALALARETDGVSVVVDHLRIDQ